MVGLSSFETPRVRNVRDDEADDARDGKNDGGERLEPGGTPLAL
jgi:hypothetical protein